ncbi:NAD-dependent succinate-semialdehyde dehydrogenase [Effusibacillus lacus]|uniref:NAD-dependent succinate-semialdehyde dehydrogenase n=1 Tax=Effusibacillus lacus TaxID=1348429 RepID=A0A292YHA9_9BACL|nr:NAD-dependent succinate-semialdehyde dehydrogenase [Effusibacillus lacus]TCS75556.1 succinate semialdehyde dehydrogenase [Effusibacillus lacus]GAX89018.1 NAD-dependent succinate-semialdehyde dehydrogenase [Effusibacillus lacus]
MKYYQLYINGEWVSSVSGNSYEVTNPATQEVVSKAAFGNDRDAALAVEVAHAAFPSWSETPAKERSNILMKIYQLMMERKEELARTITIEMGKPIREARGEVQSAADYVQWNAEEAKRAYGETIPSSFHNKRLLTIRQPVGPVGAITPWNFPLAMVTRKLTPALAAGCSVVLKPATQTPGCAAKLFQIAEEAGLPKGVANLVMGSSSKIGQELLKNPKIRKITFTGSTEVGKLLMKDAADQVKRVSMELGGHAPFIVFEDADLEAAVEGAIASKFRNAGQTCICANRIYVQSSILEEFTSLFKEKVEKMVIGNGLEESTDIGPVIDEKGLVKIQEHVDDALAKGAALVTGGKKCNFKAGTFYHPTILSQVTDEMLISTEETFGPVAPIYSFDTEEEVIRKANDTNYGLAAYFYTRDLSRAIRVYERLEYGMVGCNDPVPTTVQGPFGGWKESGIGREGGPDGLHDFLETKFVSIKM